MKNRNKILLNISIDYINILWKDEQLVKEVIRVSQCRGWLFGEIEMRG